MRIPLVEKGLPATTWALPQTNDSLSQKSFKSVSQQTYADDIPSTCGHFKSRNQEHELSEYQGCTVLQ